MIWLVDDAHLGRVLRGESPAIIQAGDEVATTGLWYVRICQAVGGRNAAGSLSTPFEALAPARREAALMQVLTLPDRIGLVGLRTLGPSIGSLRHRHRLNLLAIEAVAAAVHLDAAVLLSTSSPPLEAALGAEGRTVVVET